MTPKQYLRMASIFLGLILLLWLPFEDTSVFLAIAFTVAITGLITIYYLNKYRKAANHWWFYPLIGLLAGMAITPLALLLMSIKSGIHGHGFPDYTPMQVVLILQLTPVWILAGFMIGSTAALVSSLKIH